MQAKRKPCPDCGKPIKSYKMHKQYCTGYNLVQGAKTVPVNNTPKATRSLEELFAKEKELGFALENCRIKINERLKELKLVRANEANAKFDNFVEDVVENTKQLNNREV